MENVTKELHKFDLFFLQNTNKDIVITPSGGDAISCYEFFKKNSVDITCFIDNNREKHGVKIDSKQIVSIDDLRDSQQNYHIVVASKKFESELVSQLLEKKFESYSIFDTSYDIPISNSNQDNALKNYSIVIKLLDDQLSQETLLSIINFRITQDSRFLTKVVRPLSNQYFEPTIYPINNTDYFVDCGAYDGDTLKSLMSHTNNEIAGYYGFEPNEHNLKLLKKQSENHSNIELINKGVYSKETTLSFDIPYNTVSSSSAISNNGNVKIEVTSLDNTLRERNVSFIKMDIEGAEVEALLGAKNIIQKQQPVLAISVYHEFDDLWKIPLLIKSFETNYKYYLRHYTLNNSETVLYCVPLINEIEPLSKVSKNAESVHRRDKNI